MPPQLLLDKTYLNMAKVISELSKDPQTKVGVIILSQNKRHVSVGYNGFVSGIEETPEKWERPQKYEYVQHAELNALLFCPFEKFGSTLYCTHQPCHRCLEAIIQSGIIRVVYRNIYTNLTCREIWEEHAKKIQIEYFPE